MEAEMWPPQRKTITVKTPRRWSSACKEAFWQFCYTWIAGEKFRVALLSRSCWWEWTLSFFGGLFIPAGKPESAVLNWSAGSLVAKASWKAGTKLCENYQLLTFLFLLIKKTFQTLLAKIHAKRITLTGVQVSRALPGLNGPDRWF